MVVQSYGLDFRLYESPRIVSAAVFDREEGMGLGVGLR